MDRPYERQINLAECKKCFVQRDYSSGLQVRFSAEFPYELEGKVGFFILIIRINDDDCR